MIQLEFIHKLKSLASELVGLRAMLLIGSCGRGVYSANSDIDVQLLVNSEFDQNKLSQLLLRDFEAYAAIVRPCGLRGKLTVYFEQYPKIDFGIYTQLSDLNRNYIGSELTDLSTSVLYLCPEEQSSILKYLQGLLEQGTPRIGKQEVEDLIDRFVYEYESASMMHRRSDAYQFYFFYNIALQCVVQLSSLAHGVLHYNFLPKKFTTQCSRSEQKQFTQLAGTLFLPEGNALKRRLLDYFYPLVEQLVAHKLEETKAFCEMVYERDYFWNFRDLSRHIPSISPSLIYRSSALSLVLDPDKALELLNRHQISTIIDLRAVDKCVEGDKVCFRYADDGSYAPHLLEGRNYVLADLDPWEQPQSFIDSEHHRGTNAEIAYRFFVVACQPQIRLIMQTIIEASGPVLIHCFAGKDRTGIVAAMLAWLSGANPEQIMQDYLASEQDTQADLLRIALDLIEQYGGIEAYLSDCGLEPFQIQELKYKLKHG